MHATTARNLPNKKRPSTVVLMETSPSLAIARRESALAMPLNAAASSKCSDTHTLSDSIGSGKVPNMKPRKKQWSPKVRTGCSTCRARRVKCDERKPMCARCILSGRECGGYATASLILFAKQPVVSPTPAGIAYNEQELRFFSILSSDTVQQVSGAFDQEFWSTHVLRATRAYPAVWHASLALSAIHMRAKITSTSPIAHATREKYYEFALREYNASIKYLIDIGRHDKLSIADQETMLLSSLLFAGLSSIQCDYEQATTHAHNGINLFYEWRFWERADDALASKASHVLPTESLISLFAHFESQFTNRRRLDWHPQWPTLIMPESCSSEPYKTVTEAQYDFQRLLTSFLRWSGNTETSVWVLPSATPDFLGRYSAEFRLWRAKFDEFLASSYRHPSNQEAISYLQLHWLAVEICLRIDYAEGVLAWDKHTSQFRRIAELAQGAFDDIMGKRDKAGADYIGFSYSMSICEVLYFTGINCRDREIQRSVIRLLRKWPRRDGVWDSVFIANLVQARRDVEENATRRDGVPKVENCTCIDGTFVCVDHRVCYQDVEFLQDGTIQITLTTVYAFENNLPPIAVIMDTI